jgi:hypothetical protein
MERERERHTHTYTNTRTKTYDLVDLLQATHKQTKETCEQVGYTKHFGGDESLMMGRHSGCLYSY